MKQTIMTPALCDQIRTELNAALPAIAEKLGITLKTGNASYSREGTATFKLEAAVFSTAGEALSKEAVAFKQLATTYGLVAGDLGREFSTHQGTYIVTGAAPKSYKFPILCRNKADGKIYKFPEKTVAMKLGHLTPTKPLDLIQNLLDKSKA